VPTMLMFLVNSARLGYALGRQAHLRLAAQLPAPCGSAGEHDAVGDATLRVDLHALDPTRINPTRTWFSRRGTFGTSGGCLSIRRCLIRRRGRKRPAANAAFPRGGNEARV
jgi:hypothetical protein